MMMPWTKKPNTPKDGTEITDTVNIHIHSTSELKESIRALESGIYHERVTKVNITKAREGPPTHGIYSRLLAAVGRLPKLQELSIRGGLKALFGDLHLPVAAIQKLLSSKSKTIRKLRLQEIGLSARKRHAPDHVGMHPEIKGFWETLQKLEALQELEISDCFRGYYERHYGELRYEVSLSNLLLGGYLSSLSSLTKLVLRQDREQERLYSDNLQTLFQSLPLLEELVLVGFSMDRSLWRHTVPEILALGKLRKLDLNRCFLDNDCIGSFVDLFGPESPLEDFEFVPCIPSTGEWAYSDIDTLGHYHHIGSRPWRLSNYEEHEANGKLTWRKLLVESIPQTLQTNTRLRRLKIKATRSVNILIPVEIQRAWLAVYEEGHNQTLQDFGFWRTEEGGHFQYEDEHLAAKLEHHQKLIQFGCASLGEGAQDDAVINVLANASNDVSCLFHFLSLYPSLCG